MDSDFVPLFRNPHLSTLAGNFWPREIDAQVFPGVRRQYRIDDKNTVLAFEHQPACSAHGQIVVLHGLEGSADASYIKSFAQEALTRGFGVHRLNLRTCGGTEDLCETMYHSGLTADTRFVLEILKSATAQPLFLVGFSLGGNICLKLAGELGNSQLLTGVVAVSTPIDLAQSVRSIDRRINFFYARRFLSRLRQRIRKKSELTPHLYSEKGLNEVKTIWEFDDRFTAPLFGFGTAANYYRTQSAINFLPQICTPTLVIASEDDPLVPFSIYEDPVFEHNSALRLISTKHGGHMGYISKRKPRFWLDAFCINWIEDLLANGGDRDTRFRVGSGTDRAMSDEKWA